MKHRRPDRSDTTGIQRCWFGIIRRIQAAAPSRGAAVVRIGVIVDAAGCPIAWGVPHVLHIEPSTRAGEFQEAIRGLGPNEIDSLVEHLA